MCRMIGTLPYYEQDGGRKQEAGHFLVSDRHLSLQTTEQSGVAKQTGREDVCTVSCCHDVTFLSATV